MTQYLSTNNCLEQSNLEEIFIQSISDSLKIIQYIQQKEIQMNFVISQLSFLYEKADKKSLLGKYIADFFQSINDENNNIQNKLLLLQKKIQSIRKPDIVNYLDDDFVLEIKETINTLLIGNKYNLHCIARHKPQTHFSYNFFVSQDARNDIIHSIQVQIEQYYGITSKEKRKGLEKNIKFLYSILLGRKYLGKINKNMSFTGKNYTGRLTKLSKRFILLDPEYIPDFEFSLLPIKIQAGVMAVLSNDQKKIYLKINRQQKENI